MAVVMSDSNRGGVGYYLSLNDSDDLRSLASNAESTLTAPERMNLANDAWAAVRSGLGDIGISSRWQNSCLPNPNPSC